MHEYVIQLTVVDANNNVHQEDPGVYFADTLEQACFKSINAAVRQGRNRKNIQAITCTLFAE